MTPCRHSWMSSRIRSITTVNTGKIYVNSTLPNFFYTKYKYLPVIKLQINKYI